MATDMDIVNIKEEPLEEPEEEAKHTVMTNGNTDVVFTGKVVQVTNVSPGSTLQQLATLFGFLGTVTDIRLYPSDDALPVAVKLCYIKYENSEQCGVAQHLTNTVFIDKALIVVPLNREEIPEETECQHLLNTVNAYASMAGSGYLAYAYPVEDVPSPILGLPPPPVITCSTDPMELEEIKRTIFVENIHSSITSEQLMAFFSGVGEIKYMRLCKTEEGQYAFIEFSTVESVPTALQYNGVLFGNRSLKVVHAKSPVVKPESERIATGRSTLRTTRDVVKRPTFDRDTKSSLFDVKSVPNESNGNYRSPRRRRSHSRTHRSRSRSHSRRRRSRSKSPLRRRRSRTRSPVRHRRSYSSAALDKTKTGSPKRGRRSRSRSRSRSPKRVRKSRSRSRSRSPKRIRRSRSRSRSLKRRKSRSRSRDRRKKRRSVSRSISKSPRRRSKKRSKSKSRSPSRRKSRRSTSRSPDKSSSSKKKKKDKDREREKEREKDKDKKDKGKDKEKEKEIKKEKKQEVKQEDEENDDQELNSLLTKIYTFEEEQEKEKKSRDSDDDSVKKKKRKDSS